MIVAEKQKTGLEAAGRDYGKLAMQLFQQWFTALVPAAAPASEAIPLIHSFQTSGTGFPILAHRMEAEHWLPLCESQQINTPIRIGATSLAGRCNKNEDTALAFLSQVEIEGELIPVSFAVIADGISRRWGGEYASSVVAQIAAECVIREIAEERICDEIADPDGGAGQDPLADAMNAAHEIIRTNLPGSGTTATCVLTVGSRVQVAHVGDSRAYLMTNGALQPLTRDHSLPCLLEEQGRLDSAQARHFARHGFLYKHVGMRGALEIDTLSRELGPASLLLLCSDGLWEVLDDQQIAETITRWGDPQTICDRLVQMAVRVERSEDVTAMVLQLSE